MECAPPTSLLSASTCRRTPPACISRCAAILRGGNPPPPPWHNQNTFGPTEGQNEQWREANRRRQRQATEYRGLVPNPLPPPTPRPCADPPTSSWGAARPCQPILPAQPGPLTGPSAPHVTSQSPFQPLVAAFENTPPFRPPPPLPPPQVPSCTSPPPPVPPSAAPRPQVIEHTARLCRILLQPYANALLIGVGGSGRQCTTQLAAYIQDHALFRVTQQKDYGREAWEEDLRALMKQAGAAGTFTVFCISDTQITDETFLEDVCHVLNAGVCHVPSVDWPTLAVPWQLCSVASDRRE